MFNDYPSAQLYDYAPRKKVTAALHPLKGRTYGPNPGHLASECFSGMDLKALTILFALIGAFQLSEFEAAALVRAVLRRVQ